MNFSNPYSRDLGVFTWAELQAAYPNSGGALAALPAGARAFVSDWNHEFVPNAAKTRWVTRSPFMLYETTGDVAVNSASEVFVAQPPVPAGLLAARARIRVEFSVHDNGTADTWTFNQRFGTAGTTGDSLVAPSLDLSNASQRSFAHTADHLVISNTAINLMGVPAYWSGDPFPMNVHSGATRLSDYAIPDLSSSANIWSCGFYGSGTTDTLTVNALQIWVLGNGT